MHPKLIEAFAKTCAQRREEGDCPTVAAPTPGNLEEAFLDTWNDLQAYRNKENPAFIAGMKVSMPNPTAMKNALESFSQLVNECRSLGPKALPMIERFRTVINNAFEFELINDTWAATILKAPDPSLPDKKK